MRYVLLLWLVVVYAPAIPAQYAPPAPPAQGILGYWSTDAGSVLQVHRCGPAICISVATISAKAPGVVDAHNPDPALRSRPICHINIGTGFVMTDANHGENGHIYDPESGKTYKAVIASEGDTLQVRGYLGFKALGRTESWKRTPASSATCVGTVHR